MTRSIAFGAAWIALNAAACASATAESAPPNPHFDAVFTGDVLYAQQVKGHFTAGLTGAKGLGWTADSGNEFYPPSAYASDCDTAPIGKPESVLWFPSVEAEQSFWFPVRTQPFNRLTSVYGDTFIINGVQQYSWWLIQVHTACRIIEMPEVEASFIDTLNAKGYRYFIDYPQVDPGNGRALITWSKPNGGNWGSARITGVGWANQYQPYKKVCHTKLAGVGCVDYDAPQRDIPGGMIAGLPDADKAGGVRLTFYGGIPSSYWTTLPTTSPYDASAAARYSAYKATYYMSKVPAAALEANVAVVIDPWLSGSTPPTPTVQLPSIPPYVPAGDPTPINVGGVSSGGGSGDTGTDVLDGRNAVKFDYAAFCSSPGKDGQPRSPSWVANCMAGAAK